MLSQLVSCAFLVLGALPGESAYLEGTNAAREGRHGDAFQAFQRCIEGDPALAPYAAVGQARSFTKGGMRNDAAAAYQRVVALYPEGPWTLMARADLAALLDKEQPALAQPHYAVAIAVDPRPWWMDELVWDATRNLLAQPEMRPAGFALLRERVETTIYVQDRLDASRMLLESKDENDHAIALLGILRSGETYETGKALRDLGKNAIAEGGATELVQRVAAQLSASEDGGARAWLRLALAYTARQQAIAGNFDVATATARQLAVLDPDHRTAGDTFWWLGWYHEYKERPALAAKHYEALAETCPDHYRADDALLEAALMWQEAKDSAAATKALEILCTDFEKSSLVAEAYYMRARAAKDKATANAFYARAAEFGFGSFYGHRAGALGDADVPRGAREIALNPAEPVARLIAPREKTTIAAAWDERLETDIRVQRLRFFGAHGLEAGRWEALAFADDIDAGHPDPLPHYRALAEAGFCHTALRFADAKGHLDAEERKLILYPLAYWPQASRIAEAAGIDPLLMLSIARQESTFRSTIRSRAGATGVMQLMPTTADWLAEVESTIASEHAANLDSAENSLRLGAVYIRRMLERSKGGLVYALASYNAGPGNCDKWRRRFPNATTDEFIDAIPFSETKDYVKKVLGNYAAYHSLYRLSE